MNEDTKGLSVAEQVQFIKDKSKKLKKPDMETWIFPACDGFSED